MARRARAGREAGAKGAGAELTVRPLRRTDWGVVERLFGARGACGGCWCMHWRTARGGKDWEAAKGEPNRQRLRALVEAGDVNAVVAFAPAEGSRRAEGEPVGWCTFGPRATFPRLSGSRVLRHAATTPDTWAIVCFYIPAAWRGRGVATRLVEAATARAFELGARAVEGYPVVPRTDRLPAAFAWTGVPALFERAGYQPLPRAGGARPIVVRRSALRRGARPGS